MPLLTEGMLRNRKSDLFTDIASMRRDGFATDTRAITVDNQCPTATTMDSPVLAQKAFPVKRDLFKTEEKSDDEKDVAIYWV